MPTAQPRKAETREAEETGGDDARPERDFAGHEALGQQRQTETRHEQRRDQRAMDDGLAEGGGDVHQAGARHRVDQRAHRQRDFERRHEHAVGVNAERLEDGEIGDPITAEAAKPAREALARRRSIGLPPSARRGRRARRRRGARR
jgi:hypothetical protein